MNLITGESDCDALDAAQRLQGVARFAAEHLLQEIAAVTGQQRLQKLRSLLHRRSFRCVHCKINSE